MYVFNWSLFENLPKITGVPVSAMKKEYGISASTWYLWIKAQSITMGSLVDLLNKVRVSMADLLTSEDSTPVKKGWKEYVMPKDLWTPIVWHNESIGKLYGNGEWARAEGPTALAKKLECGNFRRLQRWEANPDIMRLEDLLNLLNRLKIDAKLFIEDNNGVIELPVWKDMENMDMLHRIEENNENLIRLQSADKLKEKRIVDLSRKVEQLQAENRELRSRKESVSSKGKGSVLGESELFNPFRNKGYVFHSELWKKMPELFDVTLYEFCKIVGMTSSNFINVGNNVKLDKLIAACNYFHMSICHFFPPKSEPLVVQDRIYYEIPSRIFVPIESRVDNMKYIFGRYSVFGHSVDALKKQTGIGHALHGKLSESSSIAAGKLMSLTLADVCTSFNISPMVFLKDENKKGRPSYAVSNNELLLLNSIDMMKEIENLRAENRKLKSKLKEK